MSPIILYHGSRAWTGPPTVKPSRAKRTEHGPGIYLTTSVETARRYARGGGRVLRFELDPRLTWIDQVSLPIETLDRFLGSVYRLRKRQNIKDDLLRYASRTGKPSIPAEVLINLMVNYDALVGDAGPAVAGFLVQHGVDAMSTSRSSDEDWVVLLNPKRVLGYRAAGSTDRDAPRLSVR